MNHLSCSSMDYLGMQFDTIDQAVDALHILHRIFTIIRIWDDSGQNMLYSSKWPGRIAGENNEKEQFAFEHAALSCNELASSVQITIRGGTDVFEIVTFVPVFVNEQPCSVELVQCLEGNMKLPYEAETGINTEHSIIFRRMQEMVITDPLTGLYNRRYIDEQLPRDMEDAFALDRPLTVIYADIDFFKIINDEHGHVMGDKILKEIAGIFEEQVSRRKSWVARYGGEEFLFCLPEADKKAAFKIAERIRKSVEKYIFHIDNKPLKVTCSFGVHTSYRRHGLQTADEIISHVDRKLYQAKREGRNKVVV